MCSSDLNGPDHRAPAGSDVMFYATGLPENPNDGTIRVAFGGEFSLVPGPGQWPQPACCYLPVEQISPALGQPGVFQILTRAPARINPDEEIAVMIVGAIDDVFSQPLRLYVE